MRFKQISLMLLIVMPFLFQTGCWDRWELDDQGYVVAFGIDSAPGELQDRVVTAQIVIPSKLVGGAAGGGGGGDSRGFFQVSVRTFSLFDALDVLQGAVARRLTMLQCRVIFVSEDLARESLTPLLRVVERSPELRRTVFVAVVPGKVEEFMRKNVPVLESDITRFYEEMSAANKFTGYTTISTFRTLMEGLETPGENTIVTLADLKEVSLDDVNTNPQAGQLPRKGGTKGDFIGVAVCWHDKMVGKLGKLEAEALNLLRGDWESAPFSIKDPVEPKYSLGVNLRQEGKPRITVDLEDNPVRLDVKLSLEAFLVSEYGRTDYTLAENRKKLEGALREEIESRARKLITRAQSEFKSDIFKFGNLAVKKKFLTWAEWEQFNWTEKFPQADIQVSADVKVRWFGSATQPAEISP